MPAYFSIEILFEKDILYPSFVRDVYTSIFQTGHRFKRGYWYGEDMSLEQIINWNQRKLEEKFKLGLKEHVKHDYKQILVDTNKCSEMRLYWLYLNDVINLHLIIPEADVLHPKLNSFFLDDEINPLIEIACCIWNTGLVTAIQTCIEFDEVEFEISKIEKGQLPLIHPFCIINKECAEKSKTSLKENFTFRRLNNNGLLIVDNLLILEDK